MEFFPYCIYSWFYNIVAFNTSLLDGKVKMPAAPVNENILFVVALKLNNKLFCTGSLVSIKDVLSTSSCCASAETHLNDKKKVVIAVFNNIIARIDAVFRVNRDSETRYKLGYIKVSLLISLNFTIKLIVSRLEKFHGSLLSDLAQEWQCPDRLVWKFWSGSDLALVSIPWQKRLYMPNEIFFEMLGCLIEIDKCWIKMVFEPKLY